jgi:purine-binding chemotaxis protein CheW
MDNETMIDLADIRKKAQAQKSTEHSNQKGEGGGEPVSTGPVQGQAPNALILERPGSQESNSAASNALERLFSQDNTLQPVSEEAYFHGLAGAREQTVEKRREWLTFRLGQENYALDIKGVAEIIKPREVAEIPRVPDFVLGLISLRGVIAPVFDLKRRLRLGPAQLSPASRIIICQKDDLTAGMLVDGINQVIRIAERHIEPPPAMLQDIDSDLVEGVGRHQGNFLILLNLDGILHVGGSYRQGKE